MSTPRIKVCSPSFSQNAVLRRELQEAFPGAVFNDDGIRFDRDGLIAFLADADGVVVGLEKIDAAVLDARPGIKIVAKYGVGLDNIDVPACRARSVAIGWTGGVNRRSVAELALCFMLGLCRNVFRTSTLLRNGQWEKNGGVQLSGKTVGIIGLGFTGREVARLLEPLHCRVLGNDILAMDDYCQQNGIIPATKGQIFAEADLITLHVPHTAQTAGLINAATLAAMKPGAFLINTCRGEVVDQAALKQALITGPLGGAAMDVFAEEPPTDMDLLSLPNLISTAHIGGNALEAVVAMGRSANGHLMEFFGGEG